MVCQVTIPKSNLHQALTAAQRDKGIYAQLWRPKCSQPPNIQQITPSHHKGSVETSKLRITTWNCRGLHTGEPYLHHLAEGYSDILVVTERGLWPYEAHKLSTVHAGFDSEVVIDNRLTDCSN